jgi:hypothetical protein
MFHHSVHPPFQLTPNVPPEGAPLFPNLTSFVYVSTGLSHGNIYSTHDTLSLFPGFAELVRFVEQCPNLQVFSICNTPLYKLSDEGYPAHAWCPPALVDLLVQRPLKSLTLMGLKIKHDAYAFLLLHIHSPDRLPSVFNVFARVVHDYYIFRFLSTVTRGPL